MGKDCAQSLSKAFKYTFVCDIHASVQPVGESFELSVRDTAVGIPQVELDRVFDHFHRVEEFTVALRKVVLFTATPSSEGRGGQNASAYFVGR